MEGDRRSDCCHFSDCRFLSTPSGWRATCCIISQMEVRGISIHALRVEGDYLFYIQEDFTNEFLSTPSGWRATQLICAIARMPDISIHALRVEGDETNAATSASDAISIHALRVEGDLQCIPPFLGATNFYPRPPGGGRPEIFGPVLGNVLFLSTPSGWRATERGIIYAQHGRYFYPRPPGGGRRVLPRSL